MTDRTPWLDPAAAPASPPPRDSRHPTTAALHDAVDAHATRTGTPWLHPTETTVQTDLGSSEAVVAWQEGKAAFLFGAEGCWSSLPPLYARYGSPGTHDLLTVLTALYQASGAVVTDSGMSAVGLIVDALVTPGSHVVVLGEVYNKTRTLLRWAATRAGGTFDEVATVGELTKVLTPHTRLVFAELVSNPLTRVLDLPALAAWSAEARGTAPELTVVVDDTIATPWGLRTPLLDQGVDLVTASLTKALSGDDTTLGGMVVSRRDDLLNRIMDLQALRGGVLDRARAAHVAAHIQEAEAAFRRRCASATRIAAFLAAHPRVDRVWHPSLPDHPDAPSAERLLALPGSLVSFRIEQRDDPAHRRFTDALASTGVFRYALSFDGLVSKVNHHRTVSEFYTAPAELRRRELDRLVRLGVGTEHAGDLIAALNWTLWHG